MLQYVWKTVCTAWLRPQEGIGTAAEHTNHLLQGLGLGQEARGTPLLWLLWFWVGRKGRFCAKGGEGWWGSQRAEGRVCGGMNLLIIE
jgi:hypothetical protein